MKVNPFNFDELLAPLSATEFFREYWEQKPLYIERSSRGYDGLISLGDLDSILCRYMSNHPIRINKNKIPFPHERFINKSNGFFDVGKVFQEFENGSTLILNKMEHQWEPFRRLNQNFEGALGHPSSIAVFLNPPNSEALFPHYDFQDIFTLQVEGQKRWKVFETSVDLPLVGETTPCNSSCYNCIIDASLKPGDLLYIPRGHVHEVVTEEQYSLHVSVGVASFKWADLVRELVENELEFRRALPIGMLNANHNEGFDFAPLDKLASLCGNHDHLMQALERVKAKYIKSRTPSSFGNFSTYNSLDSVDLAIH